MLTIIEISRLSDLPPVQMVELGQGSADPADGVMYRYYSPSLKMVRRFVVQEERER